MPAYICDDCKVTREYPKGNIGLCDCGAAPCAWMPALMGFEVKASAAGIPVSMPLLSLHYWLDDGTQASISGNAGYEELFSDLQAVYGSRLQSVALRDGFRYWPASVA
jgi:hypothetical protein